MKNKFLLILIYLLFCIPFNLFSQIIDTSYKNWIEYKNEKKEYSIKFPPDFKKENGMTFTFPKKFSWATGFRTEYIKIESGEKTCDIDTINEFAGIEWKDSIKLSGIIYRVGEIGEGAAGTYYISTYFITQIKGNCYKIIFARGHSTGGYYGDNESDNRKLDEDIKANDKETMEITKQILSTINIDK